MIECNTALSAYTMYTHLEYYCNHIGTCMYCTHMYCTQSCNCRLYKYGWNNDETALNLYEQTNSQSFTNTLNCVLARGGLVHPARLNNKCIPQGSITCATAKLYNKCTHEAL